MSANQAPDLPAAAARIRVPQHVVYRSFATETVILNLQSGKYHGVNPVGGDMLKALERNPIIAEAAKRVAADYDMPVDEVEKDMCAFCGDLAERGLVEIDAGSEG